MTGSLMLIDAAGLWFRSYYALPESLTAPDGTPVNAVRGFLDTLAKLLTERRPARLVVCLDNDWRPDFRVEALPTYKTHRVAEQDPEAEGVPDTLSPQIPVILEALDAFGITTAEAEGLEADDVLGTLAERERDLPVEVITGDRDLFQLVRTEPNPVRVVYVGGGLSKAQDYGPEELGERYSLPVEGAGDAYADMAVLRGDPSDGLPGVSGIGEKTAAKLITQHGSLSALLSAARVDDSSLTAGTRKKLTAAADYLEAAPSVVRVVRDAEVVASGDDDTVPERSTGQSTTDQSLVDTDRIAELQRRWRLGGSIDRLLNAL